MKSFVMTVVETRLDGHDTKVVAESGPYQLHHLSGRIADSAVLTWTVPREADHVPRVGDVVAVNIAIPEDHS